MNKDKSLWIAGFWRRIGAFIIDGFILGLIGYLLGLVLEDYFVQIGGWGRLVGFSISLTYFGVLNSTINKGQTIGKVLLKINVVDSNNQFISLSRSLLRYSILGIPFYLNNARITDELLLSPFIYPLAFILFGGLFATSYLYLFNRRTRQSLHDLLVGTFVTNKASSDTCVEPVWKVHYGVVGILFVAVTIAPYFTLKLAQNAPFTDMLKVRKMIIDKQDVVYANIEESLSFSTKDGEESTQASYVSVQAFLAMDDISNASFAKELGEMVVNNYSTAATKDTILVSLTYGYDLGIWSSWKIHTYNFKPNELNKK